MSDCLRQEDAQAQPTRVGIATGLTTDRRRPIVLALDEARSQPDFHAVCRWLAPLDHHGRHRGLARQERREDGPGTRCALESQRTLMRSLQLLAHP